MMNMILHSHKFFICYYINNIIILFSLVFFLTFLLVFFLMFSLIFFLMFSLAIPPRRLVMSTYHRLYTRTNTRQNTENMQKNMQNRSEYTHEHTCRSLYKSQLVRATTE